jgi:hypothetical protein
VHSVIDYYRRECNQYIKTNPQYSKKAGKTNTKAANISNAISQDRALLSATTDNVEAFKIEEKEEPEGATIASENNKKKNRPVSGSVILSSTVGNLSNSAASKQSQSQRLSSTSDNLNSVTNNEAAGEDKWFQVSLPPNWERRFHPSTNKVRRQFKQLFLSKLNLCFLSLFIFN